MANPGGGVGAKFVSVNLNKSYGQSSHPNQPYNGSYGPAGTFGRSRTAGAGGGGMVVLSRSRTMQKAGPKLSVPPPLNLPSLRKEHEKFDSSGSAGGPAGGARPGSGQRLTSSGVGWTKPVAIASQEKDGAVSDNQVEQNGHGVESLENRVGHAYLPPSSRSAGATIGVSSTVSSRAFPSSVEKAVLLRGEDFPSLQAAVPVSSGVGMKQKDNVNQKVKQGMTEDSTEHQMSSLQLRSGVDMRPLQQSSSNTMKNGAMEKGEGRALGSSDKSDKSRKQEEYFPGPLPLFRLSPRSDWADDERDTGHGFADRAKDLSFSNSENYWDRDFDLPRPSILPHKPGPERWAARDDLTGRKISSDVSRLDPYRRDTGTSSREGRDGNTWRSTTINNDAVDSQAAITDRTANGPRINALKKDYGKESKYSSPHNEGPSQGDILLGNQDSSYKTRNNVLDGRPPWSHLNDSLNRGAEPSGRDNYVKEQSSKFKGDSFQSNSMSKPYIASGVKVSNGFDSSWVSGRDKGVGSKSGRSYLEDPFDSFVAFDENDPFSGNLVGVIKRKKDINKQTDFVDPVRESFEAELERVQKMQELERQRIVEEHERALEQARRQEEERQRLVREEEERRRRLEEEAKEAAWRAEQERQAAFQRAEEQRIAREEEKRRIFLEEERTKQAARQKLLELEERIARRQAEAGKTDAADANKNMEDKFSALVNIKGVSASADSEIWVDREQMVERIKASASFDSSVSSRPLDMSSRSYPTRENPSNIVDKGKAFHPWQKGAFDNGNNPSWQIPDQKSSLLSPRRDFSDNGREVPGKEFYGGAGYMSSRTHSKGLMHEPEFGNQKDQRWNVGSDSDSYSRIRDMDIELQDNVEKFGDGGWAQSRFRGNSQPFPERQYLNSNADDPYPYGRARSSLRQPRVLPPPSIPSVQRASFKASNGDPAHSEFLHSNEQYNTAGRIDSTTEMGYYTGHQDGREQSDLVDVQIENIPGVDQEQLKDTLRCDSQSSVSVSSPPNSAPHLSHDEFDESGDSPTSAATELKQIPLSGNSPVVYNDKSGHRIDMTASSCISVVDDDDWNIENNAGRLPDEYDEDGDGYEEEDEAREGDEENLDLHQDFEDLELEEKGGTDNVNNLVLGFDQGVEVEIPTDDFERDVSNQESEIPKPDSMHMVGEVEMVDGVLGDERTQEPLNGSTHAAVAPKTEVYIEGSAVQALSDSFTSLTVETALSAKKASSTSVSVPFSTAPTTSLTTSAAHSQVDNPVKVQFGLFSGPSLIPSPVPAIQIGSIQMPLHLHPPVGASLSHLHPSQAPIFQFGSIFQGVLPLPSQSLSFVQPNVSSVFNLNQNAGGTLPTQATQDSSGRGVMKNDGSKLVMNEQSGFISRNRDNPHSNALESSSTSVQESVGNSGHAHISSDHYSGVKHVSVAQSETGNQNDTVTNHQVPLSTISVPDSQLRAIRTAGDSRYNERNVGGFKSHGHFSGSKGKRFTYAVKNSNLRPSFQTPDLPGSDANAFHRRPRRTIQRTEFRVRENVERTPPGSSSSFNNTRLDEKLIYNGKSNMVYARSGSKRGTTSTKALKSMADSERFLSGSSSSRKNDYGNRVGKDTVKEGQNLPEHGDGNLKRNTREEDFNAPLQSGVVRVFKQPGIEAPSDEDDFIEVRSKRQMLNDRREQREKEIKAKSRAAKPPRKTRPVRSGFVESTYSKRVSGSLEGEFSQNVPSDLHSSEGRGFANKEPCATLVSQPLAPIGTPAMKSEIPFEKKSQMKPVQPNSMSDGAKEIRPVVKFEDEKKDMESISMPLNSWDPVRTNQQVMALTQSQLEEAMKPPLSDAQITSVGSHSSGTSESLLPSSSILPKDRSFSSAASPINSLLAGEKIQFGAVTSPTVLPPSDRAPGSSRPDIHISHNLSMDEDECSIFFEKDKQSDVSYSHLQDPEAEAEAAASAVAVAAISSDEVVGNGLGSVALSDAKGFGVADIGAAGSGMCGEQNLVSQSRAEEPLSVSLPADLSVDTPPMSLWPPLPSPQSSSGQLLSHFPGGQPSNFPFYEMNPMLGGHIFTFGPQEEAAGSQSQPERSSTTSSAETQGTWQQCPSTVDSFYGPPAGFAGPLFSHPGGIPGVQGPPHMVVYNHFGSVAQFGQVGLSIVGPTFIPSGKPLDWKHNASSIAVGITDGHMNNANMGSGQRNPPNMSPPVQHVAQGSPMLPVPSALAMFDVSPFQAQPDMSAQARWSHVPAPPLHAVPLSHSLKQQAEGLPTSLYGRMHTNDQSVNMSQFSESRTSTPSESGPSFSVTADVNARKLPDELGLLDSSHTTTAGPSVQNSVMGQSSSVSIGADAGKTDNNRNGNSTNEAHGGYRTRSLQQRNTSSQHGHSGNYNYSGNVGTSQRNNSGNDWYNRRSNFHGRNQSFGADRGFSGARVKQVYVAKQTTSGTSTAQ